jgi:hypothetical protein
VKPFRMKYLKQLKIAVEGSYAVIFDTAAGGNILFANPKFDISDRYLKN